ncbi:MAG: hypothetical protein L0332_00315 [Chloroflexi bacterium]|nr:hypothetical protein [Chloroflexota bacterium]MCI0576799.1 hypothetical protein [Chloroflexota bacterium]MCI0643306.1 hypothetical protein [Chloroflexota bacterium]MCI0725167.1 hypothetical protein [Chloroflexota bacterium]
MSDKRFFLPLILVLAAALLLFLQGAGPAAGQEGGDPLAPLGAGFTFQGRLLDDGIPIDGLCDLRFKLFDAAAGGSQLGVSHTVNNVNVEDGLFTATVNAGNQFGSNAFTGEARWLEALVGCPAGGGVYYVLSPRYPLEAAPYALSIRPGAVISGALPGGTGLSAYNPGSGGTALYGEGHTFGVQGVSTAAGGIGVQGTGSTGMIGSGGPYGIIGSASDAGGYGVLGTAVATSGASHGVVGSSASPNGTGVWGTNSSTGGFAYGVFGEITSVSGVGVGVFGRAPFYGIFGEATGNGVGAIGRATTGLGVYGEGVTGVMGAAVGTSGANYGVYGISNSASGYAGYFINSSSNGVALYAEGSGAGRLKAVLRLNNTEAVQGMAAYFTNSSNFANTHFENGGSGQVLWLVNGGTDAAGTGGGDFITAVNNPGSDTQFRVLTTGEVRSDVGFNTPAADFAEMLPAVAGLAPGDVLVIGPDGRLMRSSEAYQASVAGVYSTQPGFVGGQPVEGELEDHVPLAVVGVVPVKASAENGPILPGDMLTTSATPGHAMRAEPLEIDGFTFYPSGVVIGKALEGLDKDTGVILMLVVLQ